MPEVVAMVERGDISISQLRLLSELAFEEVLSML